MNCCLSFFSFDRGISSQSSRYSGICSRIQGIDVMGWDWQVFKNRGNRAGASMTHSHSQLIALPVVTHNKISELRGAQEYYDKHKQCLLCDVVQHDTQSNRSRLIDENEHFVTIAPYAPMFPYETLLVPKRHSSDYESIGEDEVNILHIK